MKVLCLAEYYLPGHRAGGPVRSLSSMVQALGDEIEFSIVTRHRDWSCEDPYRGVEPGRWLSVGKARVWYLPEDASSLDLVRLLRAHPHDVLYLNSFFSPRFAILPVLFRRVGLLPNVPVLVAPRGELAEAALNLKPVRKRAFLSLAQALGLYRGAWFHAASEGEGERIGQVLGINRRATLIASNTFEAPVVLEPEGPPVAHARTQGPLRVVFLSRISQTKNLDFLLKALQEVRTPLECHVYGPVRDISYWRKCQRIAARLPAHVQFRFHGEASRDEVSGVFARHDVFFFPTRTESFGHVIAEALFVGTPVVTSDRTPWIPDGSPALQALPLSHCGAWIDAIERWCRMDNEALADARLAAKQYLHSYRSSRDPVQAHRLLFERLQAPHSGVTTDQA